VFATWLTERAKARGQWLADEKSRRQDSTVQILYRRFSVDWARSGRRTTALLIVSVGIVPLLALAGSRGQAASCLLRRHVRNDTGT
jgi:hypothetical protein